MNLQQILARFQSAASTLAPRQMATLAAVFVAVVSVTIGSAYWLNQPSYSVLFSDMDSESANGIVTKLKTDKVPYALDNGGRTVKVISSRVDELRLEFAGQGMPTSGRIGFEIFDRTAFGTTDFLEHVNYRRALEGELARTIGTIGEVASARVHIAMPQPSLFVGREQPTKASVVLKLRQNRQLSASTAQAITGLIAASVESLKPESVVIIDTFGRPLTKNGSDEADAASGLSFERQRRVEQDLTTRVVSLLEPIVGAGRVRVNVTAKINSDMQEETEERWDPNPVIRSHQSVTQSAAGTLQARGLAGTRANMPPDPNKPAETATLQASAAPLPPGAQHSAETTNYELSKTVRHRVQPRGDLVRLSVAVVLDDDHAKREAGAAAGAAGERQPRSAADIQKIHDLVAASVGLDPDRGDQLTVENIGFEETPIEAAPVVPAWQRYMPQALEFARVLGIVAVVAFAFFGIIRPMLRGSFSAPAGVARAIGPAIAGGPVALGPQGPLPKTVEDLEKEIDMAAAQAAGARKLPVLTRRVAAITEREPENAARLLRAWLTEDWR